MRRFEDRQGLEWDVVLGRESWGASVALFVPPTSSTAAVRQAVLHAPAHDVAMRQLESMDDAELQALFDRSLPQEKEVQ